MFENKYKGAHINITKGKSFQKMQKNSRKIIIHVCFKNNELKVKESVLHLMNIFQQTPYLREREMENSGGRNSERRKEMSISTIYIRHCIAYSNKWNKARK